MAIDTQKVELKKLVVPYATKWTWHCRDCAEIRSCGAEPNPEADPNGFFDFARDAKRIGEQMAKEHRGCSKKGGNG